MLNILIEGDNSALADLMKQDSSLTRLELGTLVPGKVISKSRNTIVVDLGGIATGVITGRESHDSSGTIYKMQPGDDISAVVVEDENEEGMYVLSLRKASQERAWERFLTAFQEGEIIEVVAQEVNKGGLLLEIDGIKGFIPVSQLAPLNYPRVDGGDATEIVRRLQRLVGKKFLVKIINIDEESGKLILSEKEAVSGERAVALNQLKPGQRVKGYISGIVKFGIFVTFNGLEGLVHISEIAWGHVSNPHEYGKLNDEIEVLVIGVEGEKISLSVKRLMDDPWNHAAQKYKIGTRIRGTINRITPFGAFMKLDNEINGLIHLSEISHQKVADPMDFVSIGDEVEAEVINIDPDEHRIGLSLKSLVPKPAGMSDSDDNESESKKATKKAEKKGESDNEKDDKKDDKKDDNEEESSESTKTVKKAVVKEEKSEEKAEKKAPKKTAPKKKDEKDDTKAAKKTTTKKKKAA